jgi:hypothetical protein
MDFGEVLTRAWRIIWKHKVLWIFGILAGCARGGGGGGGGGGGARPGGGQGGVNPPFGPNVGPEFQQFMFNASDWIANHLWVVVAFVVVVLILVVLAIFLGTIGRIGLIRGTFEADGGAEKLGFGALFRDSLPFFWRVFGLSFLVGLAFVILFLPLIPLGMLTAGVGLLCLIPLICILVPIAWIVGIVVQQADAAMVIENLGLVDGARRGWEVLKKNVGPLLIIWLITAVIGFVVGLAIALPILITVIPAAFAFGLGGPQISTTALIAGGVCLAVYLPILIVANGILTAYLESVWILTFLRLTRPKEAEGMPPALPANA